MAQLVVRNIEPGIKVSLQRRAKRHRRSMEMEEEVWDILRNAVKDEPTPARKLGTEIASLFKECGLPSDIPELRGEPIKPLSFDP
jgi:plasmid stability protein